MTDKVFPHPGRRLGLFGSPDVDEAAEASAPVRPASTFTLRCRTEATGRFTHRHHIRDLPPFGEKADSETTSLLGDAGEPNPSEAVLAALGACLSISIHAGAVARSIPIRRLELELSADLDLGSLWGTANGEPRASGFETIFVVVHIESDAPGEALKALIDRATLWSPLANTLHNPVHLDVTLAR